MLLFWTLSVPLQASAKGLNVRKIFFVPRWDLPVFLSIFSIRRWACKFGFQILIMCPSSLWIWRPYFTLNFFWNWWQLLLNLHLYVFLSIKNSFRINLALPCVLHVWSFLYTISFGSKWFPVVCLQRFIQMRQICIANQILEAADYGFGKLISRSRSVSKICSFKRI
jgi:hypothetical protein